MNTLIEKLKAATGPDRELDARLWAMEFELDWWEPEEGGTAIKVYDPNNGLKTLIGFIDPGKESRNFTLIEKGVPEYTASIDAALALAEEVLPPIVGTKSSDGWGVGLERSRVAGTCGNWLWDAYVRKYAQDPIEGAHTSPAIAILIALLNAIQGEQR